RIICFAACGGRRKRRDARTPRAPAGGLAALLHHLLFKTGKPKSPVVDTMVFAMCRDVPRCPRLPPNERDRATIAILRVYVRADQNTSLEKGVMATYFQKATGE